MKATSYGVAFYFDMPPKRLLNRSAFTHQPQCFWASIKTLLRAKENAFICKK